MFAAFLVKMASKLSKKWKLIRFAQTLSLKEKSLVFKDSYAFSITKQFVD